VRKLARLSLVLLVLLSYAAPVQALFAARLCACCKSGQCCRRAHDSGWMARAGCAGSCGCLLAPAAGHVAVARPGAPAPLLCAQEERGAPQTVRDASAHPAALYQRPPPSC
jgi:hypothetical protein